MARPSWELAQQRHPYLATSAAGVSIGKREFFARMENTDNHPTLKSVSNWDAVNSIPNTCMFHAHAN